MVGKSGGRIPFPKAALDNFTTSRARSVTEHWQLKIAVGVD
jgi:hypothetical protein